MRRPEPGVTAGDGALEELEEMQARWSRAFGIGRTDGQWHADPRDGAGRITRASAAGLDLALRISSRTGASR